MRMEQHLSAHLWNCQFCKKIKNFFYIYIWLKYIYFSHAKKKNYFLAELAHTFPCLKYNQKIWNIKSAAKTRSNSKFQCKSICAYCSVRQMRESWLTKKQQMNGFVRTMGSKSSLQFCCWLWGPLHCFGRDDRADAYSQAILFKVRPPAYASASQTSPAFLYSGGMNRWCPNHASRLVCFIYFLQGQDLFLCEENTFKQRETQTYMHI